MYTIKNTTYGIRMNFDGVVAPDELDRCYKETQSVVKNANPGFGLFLDLHKATQVPTRTPEFVNQNQQFYKTNGMNRSVCVLDNPVTAKQYTLYAKETGQYKYERFIDASHNQNWETAAENWIVQGIDPDVTNK